MTHYDNKVDVWAVGVITYILLSGKPPFYDKHQRGTVGISHSIINDEPDYDCLSGFSRDATQFIMSCL